MSNPKTGFQDADRLNKVRSKNEFLLPVNTQSMRRVLFIQDVERALNILRPLMDDIKVLVCLDQAARGGSQRRTHVCNVESTVRFRSDLVGDGGKNTAVALLELGAIRVGGVEVECRVLRLEQGQQSTTNQGLAIKRATQMVRIVATRWNIGDPKERSEGVLYHSYFVNSSTQLCIDGREVLTSSKL